MKKTFDEIKQTNKKEESNPEDEEQKAEENAQIAKEAERLNQEKIAKTKKDKE